MLLLSLGPDPHGHTSLALDVVRVRHPHSQKGRASADRLCRKHCQCVCVCIYLGQIMTNGTGVGTRESSDGLHGGPSDGWSASNSEALDSSSSRLSHCIVLIISVEHNVGEHGDLRRIEVDRRTPLVAQDKMQTCSHIFTVPSKFFPVIRRIAPSTRGERRTKG